MGALEWILQAVVVGLLAAALPFALRLERALRGLRQEHAVLEGSAAGLAEATRLAEAASLRLRASAETAGRQVAEKLAVAEPLRDDLQYLVERAEAIADRLDGLVRDTRAGASRADGPAAPAPAASTATAGAGGRSRAERDLLRALLQGGPMQGAA